MKRLLKQAMEFKYLAVSPIVIHHRTEYDDGYEEDVKDLPNDEQRDLLSALKNEINNIGPKGLAEYIDDEYPGLQETVTRIDIDLSSDGNAHATIKTNRELLMEEIDDLKDYLTGQYSDGFGEGFEQHPFVEFTEDDEQEIYDEENEEYYTENIPMRVELTCSLYNSKNWNMTITKA